MKTSIRRKKKKKEPKALCILCFFFPIWRRHRGAIVVVVSVAGSARSLFSIDLSGARRYLRRIDEISAGRRGVLALGGRAPRRVKTLSMFRDSLIRITPNLPVVFGIPRPCHTSERIPAVIVSSLRRAPCARPIYRDERRETDLIPEGVSKGDTQRESLIFRTSTCCF